jgi:hypothetical protein
MDKRRKAGKIRAAAFSLCFILIAAGGLMPMGRGDLDYPKGKITVSGRVRLVGTAIFSQLVITDEEDRDWYIEGKDREKLAAMEQQTVKIKGSAEYQDIILANGVKVGVRRFLRNITIVE